MQFKLTPTRTVLGEKVKHLLRFLHTIRTSTLFRKGRGDKNRVKAVFIRVSYKFHYTCEKDLEEVSQNLLARRIAFPKSLPNVIIWYFLILVTTNRTKVLDFQHVRMNSYQFWIHRAYTQLGMDQRSFLGFAIYICCASTYDYTTKHVKWHFFSENLKYV